jgi:regulator of ribonuclease activity A
MLRRAAAAAATAAARAAAAPPAAAVATAAGRAAAPPAGRAAAAAARSMAAQAPTTATPPADATRGATADLCDVFVPTPLDTVAACKFGVQIAAPIFRDYGGNARFSGRAATVKCFENNPLVRAALEEPGAGRVLVVDGGASMRCALLGDNIAEMGYKNGWSGIIINGCIRDSDDISRMPLGVKALATFPLKSSKRDPGLRDVPVSFAGVTVKPGDWVYADKDGVLVSPQELKL